MTTKEYYAKTKKNSLKGRNPIAKAVKLLTQVIVPNTKKSSIEKDQYEKQLGEAYMYGYSEKDE